MLDIAREKKNSEKRERKTRNEKKSSKNNKYIFVFTFLHRKTYILLENIFEKMFIHPIDAHIDMRRSCRRRTWDENTWQ